jgi:bifunctional N-acetylglucosamine-1-phosphate-uridyltransferase/glucosamine-1-phosphate-acetyltransferase GlmU-like protein
MLSYPLDLARSLKPSRLVVVVGFQGDLVQEKFKADDVTFILQKEQLGTGHAVLAAKPALQDFRGSILILSGDVPLLTEETINGFLKAHQARQAALSVMTVELENPKGYGRVFRNADGFLLRITEDKDLKPEKKWSGRSTPAFTAWMRISLLRPVPCDPQNAQKEYYLTDIVARANSEKKKVFPFLVENWLEVMGINTRVDLARANQGMKKIAEQHMLNGVTLIDPETTYIDREVKIGQDSVIYPNCHLLGRTSLGNGCVIEPGCKIANTQVGNRVTIKASSVISECRIEDQVEWVPLPICDPRFFCGRARRSETSWRSRNRSSAKARRPTTSPTSGMQPWEKRSTWAPAPLPAIMTARRSIPPSSRRRLHRQQHRPRGADQGQRNSVIGAGSTITKEVPRYPRGGQRKTGPLPQTLEINTFHHRGTEFQIEAKYQHQSASSDQINSIWKSSNSKLGVIFVDGLVKVS